MANTWGRSYCLSPDRNSVIINLQTLFSFRGNEQRVCKSERQCTNTSLPILRVMCHESLNRGKKEHLSMKSSQSAASHRKRGDTVTTESFRRRWDAPGQVEGSEAGRIITINIWSLLCRSFRKISKTKEGGVRERNFKNEIRRPDCNSLTKPEMCCV